MEAILLKLKGFKTVIFGMAVIGVLIIALRKVTDTKIGSAE